MLTTNQVSWRGYVSEFMVTFIMSIATIIALFRTPSYFVHVISAVFFTVLFVIFHKKIITFGNPVVTAAMTVTRKISLKLGLAFLSLQMLAGTLAGLVIAAMTPDIATRLVGVSKYAAFSWTGACAEFIAAFLFVAALFSFLHSANGNDDAQPNSFSIFIITYGTLLTAALLGSLGFVNPAYAYAIQLYGHLVYTILPLVGGVLGGLFYTTVIAETNLAHIYQSHNQ